MGFFKSIFKPFKAIGHVFEKHVIRPIVHNPTAALMGGVIGANVAEHMRNQGKRAQEQHMQQMQQNYSHIESQIASEKNRIESLHKIEQQKQHHGRIKYARVRTKGGIFGKDNDDEQNRNIPYKLGR